MCKKGEMDYNVDILFEKRVVVGFYDMFEEMVCNEK